jgi:hypothetical protein
MISVEVFFTINGKDGIFVQTVQAVDERAAPAALQVPGAVVLFASKKYPPTRDIQELQELTR